MVLGKRRLAAIMFTDMVGYTALAQSNESVSIAVLQEQRKVVRQIVNEHDGREVKTIGDGFLFEFPNALDAVRCAYDIQKTTRELSASQPESRKVVLRIGLHLGDVVDLDNDVTGDTVNVASRIEPLADEGGICVSRQIYDQVRNKFELPLSSMGEKRLKNIESPVEVFRVVMPWAQQATTVPAATASKKRIAVLPFANISRDPADEFFADGMTEELIATMSRISGLKVIARTSVMGYKGSQKTISEVSRDLGVGSVLEGSIRKVGNRARVAVQLIDSETSEHLWSESYDRELKDILEIQSDISRTVAEALRVKLLDQERSLIEGKRTVDADAYTLYLKGRYFWNERKQDSTLKAIKYFEEAIKIDPSLAIAYSGLADSYTVGTNYGWMKPEVAAPKARANAEKAVGLDDTLAEAHASLGNTLLEHTWDFLRGEKELKRAVALRPNYAQAYHWLALMSMYFRRREDALTYQSKALELDPHSRLVDMGMAVVHLSRGEYKVAMERLRRLAEEYPDSSTIKYWKSVTHLGLRENGLALEEMRKALALEDSPFMNLGVAWLEALNGNTAAAREILEKALERSDEYVMPALIGLVYLALGETEKGFALLDRGVSERDTSVLTIGTCPVFEAYWKLPAWKEIDKKLGLPPA